MAAVVKPADTLHLAEIKKRGSTKSKGANFFALVSVPAVIAVVALFLVPLALVVIQSFTNPGPQNYAEAIGSGVFQRSLGTTIRMAAGVTLICVVLAYPYAYAMVRSTKSVMFLLLGALMFAFWTSTLVRTYAWKILLNDTGVINQALIKAGVIESPLPLGGGEFAVYVGMTQVLLPYVVLTLYAQMRGIPPELELAAQSMGASRISTFFRVTLPLSFSGAVAGGLLVFVIALGFYITPQILGSSKRSYVGTSIVQQIEVFLKPGVGAAQAVVLLILALAILLGVGRVVGVTKILGIEGSEKKK
ncbi:MAG: ABC transporter permease [Leucobacter sp.]